MERRDYDYGFKQPSLLEKLDSDSLSELLRQRIAFVHEEYTATGSCTPYLLDQILLMKHLTGLDVDLNLNPGEVTIDDLPHVKETKREGKKAKRQEEIAKKVAEVREQLLPLFKTPVQRVTVRLDAPRKDGQTNADVYPRIFGNLKVVSSDQSQELITRTGGISIPLVMIVKAGPNAVRCVLGGGKSIQTIKPPPGYL